MIQAEFYERDFSAALAFPDVHLEVIRMDYTDEGGSEMAELRAYGTRDDLWDLFNWLRAPVILRDDADADLWRGHLAEVRVKIGAIEVVVSLDSMFNRVNVVYSYVAPGSSTVGTRASTGWAQDDDSVNEYGTKELLYSLSGDTPESAENKRDVVLEALRLPQPSINPTFGEEMLEATLVLRGWWETLGWTYVSAAAFEEGNTDQDISDQNVGDVADNTEAAQSFQLTTGWYAYSVEINVHIEGSPGDSLQVELCSDGGGSPGAVIDTVTVLGSEIDDQYAYVTFVLSAPTSLAAATTYWIVVSRTGALDGTNYYVWAVDEALSYASGVFLLYDGGSWGSRVPDVDALFRVNGVQETTEQIEQMIDDEGQFFEGVIVEDASGVYTSPYRDGDSTTLFELLALMQRGTTNGRRLLAEVTAERYVRVWEEPEVSSANVEVLMDASGALYTKYESAWPDETPPVGKLCQLRGLPDLINQDLLVDPSTFIIRAATYDVAKAAWTGIIPKGQASPWELISMGEG